MSNDRILVYILGVDIPADVAAALRISIHLMPIVLQLWWSFPCFLLITQSKPQNMTPFIPCRRIREIISSMQYSQVVE